MKKHLREIIFLIIVLWLFAVILSILSCNPVRKVLIDPEKFDIVKNEVIRRGYCVNDTTIISKSDTIVSIDTINNYFIDTEYKNDTVYKTKNIRSYITKIVTIRDTIRNIVIDNAHIRLLQADSATLAKKMNEYKQKAEKRLGWLIFIILCIAFGLYLRYKP